MPGSLGDRSDQSGQLCAMRWRAASTSCWKSRSSRFGVGSGTGSLALKVYGIAQLLHVQRGSHAVLERDVELFGPIAVGDRVEPDDFDTRLPTLNRLLDIMNGQARRAVVV